MVSIVRVSHNERALTETYAASHVEARLAPAEVAELTGVSTDTQRDWRRRQLVDDLGEQDAHHRWRYSVHDCFTLWIARRLSETGFNIADAIPISCIVASKLLASKNTFLLSRDRARLEAQEDTTLVTRYNVLFLRGGEWGYLETGNLMDLFKSGWPMSFVIDLWHLASTMPNQLVREAFTDIA